MKREFDNSAIYFTIEQRPGRRPIHSKLISLQLIGLRAVRSSGLLDNGINRSRLSLLPKPTLAGSILQSHILISIPAILTVWWLSMRLFRHFEQILVYHRESSECGGHNMLYMGYRFYIRWSLVDFSYFLPVAQLSVFIKLIQIRFGYIDHILSRKCLSNRKQ